ncbi:MAG: hypothetical protein WKG06_36405 [Segetibacter sp.]
MPNRRTFLKQTSLASLGGLMFTKIPASFLTDASMPAPGLQLFTFFNVIDNDVKGTLQKIADTGYKNIESAFSKKGGYYGMKPKEFASMLHDIGMSWKSHHVLGAPFKLPPDLSSQQELMVSPFLFRLCLTLEIITRSW